jgi:hypothetical protein
MVFGRGAAFAKEDFAQRRGVELAQARQADQLPARKAGQIAAAGVLEMPDQGHARAFGHMGLHGFAHGMHPQRLVVIVAHGHAAHALGILFR